MVFQGAAKRVFRKWASVGSSAIIYSQLPQPYLACGQLPSAAIGPLSLLEGARAVPPRPTFGPPVQGAGPRRIRVGRKGDVVAAA